MSDLNFRAKMFDMTSYCGRTVEKKTILDNSLNESRDFRIWSLNFSAKIVNLVHYKQPVLFLTDGKYQNYVKLEKFRKIRNILEDEKYPGRKKRFIEARDRA